MNNVHHSSPRMSDAAGHRPQHRSELFRDFGQSGRYADNNSRRGRELGVAVQGGPWIGNRQAWGWGVVDTDLLARIPGVHNRPKIDTHFLLFLVFPRTPQTALSCLLLKQHPIKSKSIPTLPPPPLTTALDIEYSFIPSPRPPLTLSVGHHPRIHLPLILCHHRSCIQPRVPPRSTQHSSQVPSPVAMREWIRRWRARDECFVRLIADLLIWMGQSRCRYIL